MLSADKKLFTALFFLIYFIGFYPTFGQDKNLSKTAFSNQETKIEEVETVRKLSDSFIKSDNSELQISGAELRSKLIQRRFINQKNEGIIEVKIDSETSIDTSFVEQDHKISTQYFRKTNKLNNPKAKQNDDEVEEGFNWRAAIGQSLLFLSIQHGYAFTQPKTREALKGKFFKDYVDSVKSLHGWADGGRFFTNYIAHPLQGALTGFIQIQNDSNGKRQRFGSSPDYWKSRLKAFGWSAAWSLQFEIGPISQASIGNVGLKGKQTYVDIVMTPVGGTAMIIAEDMLDRFVMEKIEQRTNNFYVIIFSRMLLSPGRTFANILRFKTPWFRDRARLSN